MIANELNVGFGLELSLETIQNRDPPIEKQKVNFTDTKYLICGASHASRLADAFVATGKKVINLTQKGWRANKESCAEMALNIKQALGEATGSRIVVILQLLDNTSFYSSPSEGELLVCEKENDGYYHISGDLVVAPREVTNQTLRSVLQVVSEVRGLQTVFMTPLPRYFVVPCCKREHHCANFADDGYKETQLVDLTSQWKQTKEFLRCGPGKEALVVNPVWLLGGEERKTNEQLAYILDEHWKEDPVHMVTEAYFQLAVGLLNLLKKEGEKASRKRRRSESVEVIEEFSGNRDCSTPFRGFMGGRRTNFGRGRGPRTGRGRGAYPYRGFTRGRWSGQRGRPF